MTKETAAHKAYMRTYREERKREKRIQRTQPDFIQVGIDTTPIEEASVEEVDPLLHTPKHSQRLVEGLMDFLEVDPERSAREYRHYFEMTPREVSVAIGWSPWPSTWGSRSAS
jgi:hypothetical protein